MNFPRDARDSTPAPQLRRLDGQNFAKRVVTSSGYISRSTEDFSGRPIPSLVGADRKAGKIPNPRVEKRAFPYLACSLGDCLVKASNPDKLLETSKSC